MSNRYEEAARRILMSHDATGVPTQKVLDTPWFNKMSLQEQERFIEQYKHMLAKKPGLDWSGVTNTALGGAVAGAISTVMHQVFQPGPTRLEPFAIVPATLVGAALGGMYGYSEARQQHNKDLGTSEMVHLGDALDTIIHRSAPSAPTNPYIKWLAEHSMDWPAQYGKTVSDRLAEYEAAKGQQGE